MRSRFALAVVVGLGAAACGGGGGFPDAHVKDDTPPPPGGIKLAWSLTDANDAPITCDRVSGQVVVATLRSTDVVGGLTEPFTCASLMGEAHDIQPGTYSIDFELDGGSGSGSTLATVARMDGIKITSGQTAQLPPIVFKVDATGNLAAHIAAVKAGITNNCGTGAGGAAIAHTTITLTAVSGGACATAAGGGQLQLAIGASAITGQPASTYNVDCTTPQQALCIETDQSVSATGMPSGSFLVHVRGLNAAGMECWKNDDQIAIPAAGGTKTTTLNLGFQAATSGC